MGATFTLDDCHGFHVYDSTIVGGLDGRHSYRSQAFETQNVELRPAFEPTF